MNSKFHDRTEAGRALAGLLRSFSGRTDVIVLALPRGGVPVGFEVARRLRVPLDVLIVRKLGVPGHEELAMGAIASGDVEFRNESIIHALQIPPARIKEVVRREHTELQRREQLYRGDRPQPPLAGKTAILVDDGIATGATMHAAVLAARQRQAKSVIVAVPVTSDDAAQALRGVADEVVALLSPQVFGAIGEYYLDFRQTSDAEVSNLLALSASERAMPKTAIA